MILPEEDRLKFGHEVEALPEFPAPEDLSLKLDKSPSIQSFWRGSQDDYDSQPQAWKDDDTIIKFINED